ncbi:sugar/nucleoside kinase (ribokinase family) [Vibrio crassostreae]|uniref:PfkB family carbohydrate kinase n=1 Tax=Vibrio crassostreae TaxID=246167 RepID=UPI000F460922|nr:PfkB family carbohydrate kinase [Vibrio crassostreae]ROO72109.1 sugar/nucleoside kinase (ribokinase family) [Vibrio crassostreae]ROP10760.1 sugar/nucleoside kinase (ribokinase family) [Vibrio crassostreae]ROP15630.1 sugar/nucleoside kinase (ribokinase family) [Vibrio crassostreae]ROP20702.1 sugar/nucleoside kinase (ribokinase family) [Vibrio crassostreae]ROQ80428.1 sugar/nucleoside kinase (ribokinase family) [Vibrio crassostreae]
MPHSSLVQLIPTLQNKRQLCLIGAAVVDIVTETPALPKRGTDVELTEKGIHVGGCALNIAIALKKLGVDSVNALPIGQGKWADIITSAMAEKGLTSSLQDSSGDNGWCLALVEPDGERTFLSVSGVENNWNQQALEQLDLQDNAIVYLSGYQLSSACGEQIVSWLETLPSGIELFIDFGPRIGDIPKPVFERLVKLKPTVSLNRQEAEVLGMQDINTFVEQWHNRYGCPLILRIDSDGALFATQDGYGNVAPFKATVVDTIGAGDTHAGGVLAGLASGWELPDAILLGNAVASYVVSHVGGDCAPSVDEITDYLNQY